MMTARFASSIGFKIGVGLASMALLSAVVGGIGLHGTRQLGLAVEQTSAAASALTEVGDAAGAVGAFIGRHDPDVMERGLKSIEAAAASVDAAVLSDAQRTDVTGALSSLEAAMSGLRDSYATVAGAREALTTAAVALSARAGELEKASAAEMDRRETESLNVTLFLTTLRDLSTQTAALRSSLIEARLALVGGPAGADAAAAALAAAGEAMKAIEGKSGATTRRPSSPRSPKSSTQSRGSPSARRPTGPHATSYPPSSRAPTPRSATSSPPMRAASPPRRRTSGRAIRARSKAKVAAGMARNFGDLVKAVDGGAAHYLVTRPTPGARASRTR